MAMHGIDRDVDRFRQIIRGKIKQDLKKYMSQDGINVYGKEGRHKITVPLPQIQLPRFTYGKKGGGVGQGKGPGRGDKAGNDPADNPLEVNVTLEEMAELLGEELELPRIEPKGKSEITIDSNKYRTIRTTGPESLRHFKKTFRQALKRQMAEGTYDPDDPCIIPMKEDKRYRASKPITIPHNQAVIFYLMDVSGSMGMHEKEMARLTSFWIDLWLRSQYQNIKSRYIIHNYTAKEVDQHTFYHTMESGGTRIASAYELTKEIIKSDYNPADWNTYVFQYSDGDDWGDGSSNQACDIIQELLPGLNQVSYCQVRERGDFMSVIKKRFEKEPKVCLTSAFQKDQILDAIKGFFSAGN
jgi:uncharacterized sporulation protein YeaH/YhbH (DUF444 family)